MAEITEAVILDLREKIRPYVNERTYRHILGVERECAALAKEFMPDKEMKLRCAGLLHDITKNETMEKQLQYVREFDIISNSLCDDAPKLFHSKTASVIAQRDFPDIADDEICDAVWWHTTGHENMTMFQAIVYLADYIEDTRTFDDCIALRHFFYDGIAKLTTHEDKIMHFYKTMVKSFDYTMDNLISENALIDCDTLMCRNYYLRMIKKKGKNK